MADPLSLLRQYNVNKKEIVEKNNYICFGESCWPKTVKTNYLVYGSVRDGPGKKYYDLDCLLFFLKNVQLQHGAYVKQAAAENIPAVNRPDRKEILAYLSGETATSSSIDKSAPIELPVSVAEVLKHASTDSKGSSTILGNNASANDADGPTPSKLQRLDMQKILNQRQEFAARLDAPKIKKSLIHSSGSFVSGDPSDKTTSLRLSNAMSNDQIAALKAKRLAKKRSTIIDADSEFDAGQNAASGGTAPSHSVFMQYDSDVTREIQSKERVWRNRSNILQSTGKNFQKSIFPIITSLKTREEGSHRRPNNPQAPAAPAIAPTPISQRQMITPSTTTQLQQQQAQQQYNRYDQERFTKNDTIGFRIDTTGTYHGLTLKSVTEGTATNKNPSASSQSLSQNQPVSKIAGNKPQKRVSRTPIIIIPATTTSLITMYNAKAILQDLKYVDGKPSSDIKRENETLVQRRKPDNTTVPYRVIDNPQKLSREDWDRVVAVFVQGPAWQFKGWPWENPVELFSRVKGFHLKFDEMKLDPNVSKWAVEVIELSRTKRHLDRAMMLKFWSILDQHILKHNKRVRS